MRYDERCPCRVYRAERSVGALDAHASATRSLSGTCQSECLDERWLSGCASGGAGYSVESSNMQIGRSVYCRVSPPDSTRPSHWGGTPKPRVRACIGMVRSIYDSRESSIYDSRGRPRHETSDSHETRESVRRGVRHAPPARPVAPPIGGLDPRLTYGQIALPQRHSTARHCAVNRAAHPCTGRAASCPSSRLAQTSGTPGIQ